MVYMAADNTLSPYAKMDVNEMEAVGSSSQVKVVVEAEFKYVDPDTTPGVPQTTMRGLVAQDRDTEHMGTWYTEIGDRDMTDPATLTEFITWAARTCPANHYALVIWSHGMGWKGESADYKGAISDNGSTAVMSTPNIAQAIRDSGVNIEVINFDACLMGMYEVAYELGGLASYLVASEEEYPAYGDPYSTILTRLTDNSSMSAENLAETIADRSYSFYQGSGMTMTRSVVDLEAIDELHAGIKTLAQYLIGHMGAQKAIIEEARSEAVAYDYPDNIDLGDFLQKLHDKTGDAGLKSIINGILQGSLPQAVVLNDVYVSSGDDSDPDISGSRGIAIYLPSSDPVNGQISPADLVRYSGLACSQPTGDVTWIDFLNSFLF
jgi:hypothetical protein